jgi:glycosyltransferase involved in cell wall biosynthesis
VGCKARVLYNGVDVSVFRSNAKNNNQLLFVGRFTRTKGVSNLLEALLLLPDSCASLKVILVGPTAPDYDWKHHEEQVRKLQNRGMVVSIFGHLESSELSALYASSTVFVLPSVLEEAFGMVAIEAMAAGTAVVASDCGGIPEATGGFAILVDRTPKALSLGILELLTDGERRHQLETDGQQFVTSNYSWDAISLKFASMVLRL